MKKKTLISMLALVLALFVGLFCTSCFGDLPDSNSSDKTSVSTESAKDSESVKHTHSLTKVAAKTATCLEAGNIEYYSCTCGKVFADKDGKQETTLEAVKTTGTHNYKEKTEQKPTYYAPGVKAHYICEKCSKLFVKSGEEYIETTAEALAIKKLSLIDGAEEATAEPDGLLHIESGKVKNMTYGGLYTVDETTAYYYSGSNAKKAETRFITQGTYTGDGERTYNYHNEVIKFSFRYKLINTASAQLAESLVDGGVADVIIQILEPQYTHNYAFDAENDGEWHKFEYTLTASDRTVFAGFIIKFGELNGELLVANIIVDTEQHNHVYGEWTTTKDATCEAAGSKKRVCECGVEEIETITALGHDYKSVTEDPATYYKDGVQAHYICKRCSKLFVKSGEEYTETTATALVISKKKIKDETTDSVVDPSSSDLINQAVADKVKQVEQTVPTFVKILNKNGVEVQAIYLSRTAGWGENVANGDNNYSFSEFRIPVSGKIASISFEYKLVDFNPNDTCACSGLKAGDKNLGMKSFLEYKHDNDYTNETRDTYGISCFVADGEWHTFSFDHEMSGMQNILFKIHHFQGEFVVTNIIVTLAHEHSYSNWTVTTVATCEAAGSKKRVCECGVEEIETITALGHDYKSVTEDPATYYKDGIQAHYTCERCSKLFVKSGEEYTETTAENLKINKRTLLEETSESTKDETSGDYINSVIVLEGTSNKLKYLDQTDAVYVTTSGRDGKDTTALYISNTTHVWSDADDRVDDGTNNYGFGEFRIAVTGKITGVSFDYRLVDSGKGVSQFRGTGTTPDKSYHMKHMLEYKYASTYTNEASTLGDSFLIADGEWHTFTLMVGKEDMKAILLKIYHFTGEMLVTNYRIGRDFLSECTDAARGTSDDYINTIVDEKLKFLDQTPTTGTKFVTTADKNGDQVLAAYFSNSTAWSEATDRVDDSNNNWGFGEFRIALSGNITKISFEYRMWDFGNGVCQVANQTDKSYGMKHSIEYSAATYTNVTKDVYGDRFLIADGEWHTFTLEVSGTGMKNVLLKMYHFTGEMLVTNYKVGRNFLSECTDAERGTGADYINTIVDGKLKYLDQTPTTGTKFVTTADKNGDQVLAAYFSNSTAWSEAEDRVDDSNNNWGFGEFRIALNGENITKISFEYRMWDFGNGVCQVANQTDKSYGMKHSIEYSEVDTYYNRSKSVYGDRFLIADGEWHTFTLEATGTGMKNVLLKMYHFTGEMLVTNYTVTIA